jgi:hypothetical protein
MKPGMIVTGLAVLGLTIFAAHDAQGAPKALEFDLYGGNFITSSIDGKPTPLDGQAVTALQSGLAKGPGKPLFFSQAVLDAIDPEDIPGECLVQGLGGALIEVTIVFTFNDGSLLSITTDDDSYYCTDGSLFSVVMSGPVTGGEGRYEGAAGTWSGSAEGFQFRLVGDASIDLD